MPALLPGTPPATSQLFDLRFPQGVDLVEVFPERRCAGVPRVQLSPGSERASTPAGCALFPARPRPERWDRDCDLEVEGESTAQRLEGDRSGQDLPPPLPPPR